MRNNDKFWQQFETYVQRSAWVELEFMAEAAKRRFAVSRPWGVLPHDVGVECCQNFLRVQVKSTTYRVGAGYLCQFKPNHLNKQDYALDQIDLFAALVIPEQAWYLIPAGLLLGKRRKTMAMLCPLVPPAKKASYCYEGYRDAWHLLGMSREELLQHASEVQAQPRKKSHHKKVAPPISRSLRKGGPRGKTPTTCPVTGTRISDKIGKGTSSLGPRDRPNHDGFSR